MKTDWTFSKRLCVAFVGAGIGLSCAMLLCPPSAHGQGGVPLWTNLYDGGYGDDGASGITVDASGNLFVTGHSRNSASDYDYVTIKYSTTGLPLWTNRYDGGYGDNPGITVDASGNLFVTGSSRNAASDSDGVTIKYSNAGVPLWTNIYAGPGNSDDYLGAIAVDSEGNVFVTGTSSGNYLTVAYSNAGAPLWTNLYDKGVSGDFAVALALDNTGNLFVTGNSYGGSSDDDYATVAYSNAGVPLWTNRYNGPGNFFDDANGIAVDSNGNVLVTGWSVGSRSTGIATIKYSNAGVPLWTNRYDGPGKDDGAYAITVDSSGNVIVAGYSSGGAATGFNFDFVTIKYSSEGALLWTRRYNSTTNSAVGRALAVDNNGNIFVTGSTSAGSSTIAYSTVGAALWTNQYNGSLSKVIVDGNGNVFVTGSSSNGTDDDYVTIKYSSSLPPSAFLDFQLLNNQLVLSWTKAGFTLQSAPLASGTFTNIPGATSPYTNSMTSAQQYFRLTTP